MLRNQEQLIQGFYVELDKYNERYEKIATTAPRRGKDNYTKKKASKGWLTK